MLIISNLQISDVFHTFAGSHFSETTPKWHSFMMIRLSVSMAWIKQRTAEYRMSNNELRRVESLREIYF